MQHFKMCSVGIFYIHMCTPYVIDTWDRCQKYKTHHVILCTFKRLFRLIYDI